MSYKSFSLQRMIVVKKKLHYIADIKGLSMKKNKISISKWKIFLDLHSNLTNCCVYWKNILLIIFPFLLCNEIIKSWKERNSSSTCCKKKSTMFFALESGTLEKIWDVRTRWKFKLENVLPGMQRIYEIFYIYYQILKASNLCKNYSALFE